MGRPMGLDFGLDTLDLRKRKFRWLFGIFDVSAGEGANVPALPPKHGGRPKISFRDLTAEHLLETIKFPGKPEWGTVDLTLYDLRCNQNQVFEWLVTLYDPQVGEWNGSVSSSGTSLKRTGILTLYDGCGEVVERWTYENCYPTNIDWGDLDMESSDYLTVEITLNFDRAYIQRFVGKQLI